MEEEDKKFVEAEMQVEGGNDEIEQQQQQEEEDVKDSEMNENVYEDRKEIIHEDENGTKVEINEEKRVEIQDGTTTVHVTKITKTVEIQETKQILPEEGEGAQLAIEGESPISGEQSQHDQPQDEEEEEQQENHEQEPEEAEEQDEQQQSQVAEGGAGGFIQLEEN